MSEEEKIPVNQLIQVRTFVQMYPIFSEASVRNYITKAEKFGLGPAIVRMGGRVLIDHEQFIELLRNYGQNHRGNWRKTPAEKV